MEQSKLGLILSSGDASCVSSPIAAHNTTMILIEQPSLRDLNGANII